jgi:hypothetical protein
MKLTTNKTFAFFITVIFFLPALLYAAGSWQDNVVGISEGEGFLITIFWLGGSETQISLELEFYSISAHHSLNLHCDAGTEFWRHIYLLEVSR